MSVTFTQTDSTGGSASGADKPDNIQKVLRPLILGHYEELAQAEGR